VHCVLGEPDGNWSGGEISPQISPSGSPRTQCTPRRRLLIPGRTMAVTEPAVAAGTAVPMGVIGGVVRHCVLDAEGLFPIRRLVSIAFDENPSKNCGLGRGGGCAGDFAALCDADYRQGEASIAGKTAEDFPLEITGKPVHLADRRARSHTEFWATWCPLASKRLRAKHLQKYIEARNGVILASLP